MRPVRFGLVVRSFFPTQNKADLIKVQDLGVKKFRSFLRKNGNSDDFEVYKVQQINNILGAQLKDGSKDPEMDQLLNAFLSVFREDLPEGLPPEREVDHKIEVAPDARPPHGRIFQLSPAELLATKTTSSTFSRKDKYDLASLHTAHLFSLSNKKQKYGWSLTTGL